MSDQLPKKSLGQHWLNDQATLEAICEAASIQPSDVILEIGPGHGTLTKLLTQRAEQVVAVELDDYLANQLQKSVNASNLTVVNQDILRFDLTTLRPSYKVVANIPYYLTSNLLRTLSESSNPPSLAVLLTQKEVAERVAAAPGAMSLLSTTVQFYWQVELGPIVEAKLFTPPPKVDSRVLILKRLKQPLFPDVDQREFFRLVKAGYVQRRKTLLNNLSAALQLDRLAVKNICESVNIDPGRRAQTLSMDEWHNLYISLHT